MSTRREVSSSMTSPSSGNAAEQFLVGDWASLVSVNQDVEFNGSSGLASYNVRERQSQENSSLDPMVEQFRGPSPFNNQSNPGTVNSFDLLKSAQAASTLCPPDFYFTNKQCTERNNKGKKRKNTSDCGALHPHSPQDLVRSIEAEQLKIVSPESIKSPEEKEEKKQKSENSGGITRKTNAKHAMECSQDDEATKEDYIHVRAKRGQATNSHSLAERVRREKISERMRLLQDLVPGCNKITGKAMMLDEIINYVQSLQRQVEFLSMKLAAVNPELQYDIDQIISKDILQSGDGGLAVFGCGPGMSTLHPHLQGSSSHGIMQPEMLICNAPNSGDMMRSSIHNPMAQLQGVWDDELQTALQMGLIPNLSAVASDLNGSMKMEL